MIKRRRFITKIGAVLLAASMSMGNQMILSAEEPLETVAEVETSKPEPVQTEAPAPPPQTEAPVQTESPAPPQTEVPEPPAETLPDVPEETAPDMTEAPVTETIATEDAVEQETYHQVTEPVNETISYPETADAGVDMETGVQTESESEIGASEDVDSEALEDTFYSPYSTNEELIAHQHIQNIEVKKDFRFTKTDAKTVILKKGAVIREERSETSRKVAVADDAAELFLLEEGEEWDYVENGHIRGFVNKQDILPEGLSSIVLKRGTHYEGSFTEYISPIENKAQTYLKVSAQDVVIPKVLLVAKGHVLIYDKEDVTGNIVGSMESGAAAYLIATTPEGNYFVESGDSRGFIAPGSVVSGSIAASLTGGKDETDLKMAVTYIPPEENNACYYSVASIREANQTPYIREAMVNFAMQFIGNPYVWGGTSLTNGADCSGYVQAIYANYGYTLPRVACDQAEYGMQIPVSQAQPGDLVFYAKDGYVYHVAMYIGDGMTVQAANSRVGIVTRELSGDVVWATNVIG